MNEKKCLLPETKQHCHSLKYLLEQTYFNVHHIFIDGGDSNSFERCRSQDKRVTINGLKNEVTVSPFANDKSSTQLNYRCSLKIVNKNSTNRATLVFKNIKFENISLEFSNMYVIFTRVTFVHSSIKDRPGDFLDATLNNVLWRKGNHGIKNNIPRSLDITHTKHVHINVSQSKLMDFSLVLHAEYFSVKFQSVNFYVSRILNLLNITKKESWFVVFNQLTFYKINIICVKNHDTLKYKNEVSLFQINTGSIAKFVLVNCTFVIAQQLILVISKYERNHISAPEGIFINMTIKNCIFSSVATSDSSMPSL